MRKIPILVMTCAVTTIAVVVLRGPSSKVLESTTTSQITKETAPQLTLKEPSNKEIIAPQADNWLSEVRAELTKQLQRSDYSSAIQTFDQAFNRASSSELQQLHAVIIGHSAKLSGNSKEQAVIQLLEKYTQTYDELDAWRMLVSAYRNTKQWQAMLDALLRANQLEIDTDRFANNLRAMMFAASKLSAEHDSYSNELAVRSLYQNLYEQYPQYPRFQYELAVAHLALGAEADARPLLQALIYDHDLGNLAKQRLAVLDSSHDSVIAQREQDKKQQSNTGRQIVVPLIRAGTSLLVDAQIEGTQSRLLLDTGASITALSTRRIQQLGLRPTGKSIRLSTANGVTSSQLYLANSLTIGQVKFRDLVVAEIDLSESSRVDGLLGTDVLRKMNDRYSYLIDDQQNALIFRARP